MDMDTERRRIPLYKVRLFGEKIGDTFSFVGENLKPLLKWMTCVLVPLALLLSFVSGRYLNAVMSMQRGGEPSFDNLSGFLFWYVALVLSALLLAVVMPAAIYGLMRIYEERDQRLRGLTWVEFKPVFLKLLKRSLVFVVVLALLGVVVVVAFGALVALLASTGLNKALGVVAIFLLMVVLLVLLVPLALSQPIYLFEDDISLMGALKKSYRLGMRTWWGIIGVSLVLSIIVSIVVTVLSLPYAITLLARISFFADGGGESFVNSFGFSLLTGVLSFFMFLVSYLCYSLLYIGYAYQYGHAAEKWEKGNGELKMENGEWRIEN